MAFQEQVGRYRARGIAGQMATPDQQIYTVKNYLSDGTVKIGCFAYLSSESNQKCTAAGTGAVLGLAVRNVVYPMYDVRAEGLTVVPEGYAVTLATRGDFYVETTGPAAVGEVVFASNTDGSIKTAAAGSTQAGYTETMWQVKDALDATSDADGKGLILISSWTTSAATTTGGGSSSVNFDLSKATGTLSIDKGGTGATSADAARTALGLGTLATKDSPLAVADGGTGATTAEAAKTNLEIATGA